MSWTRMSWKFPYNNLKLMFFIFIIPVIILGEFIRVLHRVGSYEIKQSTVQVSQAYVRTSDNKKIGVKYTNQFDKCVILIHGYLSSSKRSIMKYEKILFDNGLDFVAIDFRNHGLSTLSLPVSAGYYERLEVMSVIRWTKRKWTKTFLLASSLGSYAAGYALADLSKEELPNAAILESFGVDIKIGTRQTLIEFYRFPYLLASMITIYAHIRSPVMFKRNVIHDIQKIEGTLPILIAHGTKDKIYPPKLIQAIMKKRFTSQISFIQIPDAEHSQLYLSNKFKDAIINFFNNN